MRTATPWVHLLQMALAGLVTLPLSSCGLEDQSRNNRSTVASSKSSSADAQSRDSQAAQPRLAQESNDQVIGTLVIPFGQEAGANLTDDGDNLNWVVDMEQRENVDAGVAPQKYLRVKGELNVPKDAENRAYDVGCLFVELKDNVYYRERTWLRISTTGINGDKYQEVQLPLLVDLGGWKNVPVLDQSLDLQRFAGNTLKKFDGTVCFRLDFANAPAQAYKGQIVVQYLRPGMVDNPPACNMASKANECLPGNDPGGPTQPPVSTFACAVEPVVLKAGQQTTLAWSGSSLPLELKLAADPITYSGALGSVKSGTNSTATYTAPSKVTQNLRMLVSARPIGSEILPAFCEVHLIGDDDIGVPDDGEVQGVTGNIFVLPVNTPKLPDLDKMTPVDTVVVNNLDIPERSFSAGFPGVRGLFEWFAIKFRGEIKIPQSGTCNFKLTADDGANLYIDDVKVVDNDGVHATQSKTGSANLSAGTHKFRVDYYQGPRYHITLQLFWQCGNSNTWEIVPATAFTRPLQ